MVTVAACDTYVLYTVLNTEHVSSCLNSQAGPVKILN